MNRIDLPDDGELSRLYLDDKLTLAQIGVRYKTNASTILYRLRRAGVKTRNKSESAKLSFSGGRKGVTSKPDPVAPVNGKLTCITCKREKLISEFRTRTDTRSGYSGRCNPCSEIRGQQWRLRDGNFGHGLLFCGRCAEWKTFSDFSKATHGYRGYSRICRRCLSGNAEYHDWLRERENLISEGMKYCPGCDETKSISSFGVHAHTPDGYQGLCRKCKRQLEHALYRKKNPIIKSGFSLEEKLERRKKSLSRYYRNHYPEIRFRNWVRSISKRADDGQRFTQEQWNNLIAFYSPNNECLCCGVMDRRLGADHVVPLSKGGSGRIFNIQPMCFPCNARKNAKTVDYRPDRGFYAQSLVEDSIP